MLDLIGQVTEERGIVTLISLHDLNLAARYAAQFVVMDRGAVYASGDADSVLTPQMLRDVYGVNATVATNPGGILQITPIGSIRSKKPRLAAAD